jgi:hypothetical protein
MGRMPVSASPPNSSFGCGLKDPALTPSTPLLWRQGKVQTYAGNNAFPSLWRSDQAPNLRHMM